MSTRRVLTRLGLMKSPLSTVKTLTPVEKNLYKKINQKKEGIQGLQGLALYEGRNLSNVIEKEKQKVEKMENRLANIQGKNTMKYITNPGYMGGRKTRKQLRKRMTRRRR
jgi:hypothetical protein